MDAAPLYGCYVATDSPTLAVTATGVRIAGTTATIPFRYEMHKIGPGLSMRVMPNMIDGKRAFQQSEGQFFYRVLFLEGRPVIRVAFGKGDHSRDYVRYPSSNCPT